MPGYAFDESAARRIARMVPWAERQMGDTSRESLIEHNRSQEVMVQTPSSLPGGYSGSTALYGTIIVKNPEGNITTTGYAFIKAVDSSALPVSTIYKGTFVGPLTQSGMTAPLVHVVPRGSGSGGTPGTPWAGSGLGGKVSLSGGNLFFVTPNITTPTTNDTYALRTSNLSTSDWRWWLSPQAIATPDGGTTTISSVVYNTAVLSNVFPMFRYAVGYRTYDNICYTNDLTQNGAALTLWDPLYLTRYLTSYKALVISHGGVVESFAPTIFMATHANWPTGYGITNPFYYNPFGGTSGMVGDPIP